MLNKNIKNLIFDLGGVILDLDVPQTLKSFSLASGIDEGRVQTIFKSSKGFEAYEKGLMSDEEFRNFVRGVYNLEATDDTIDTCWNAMLRGIPSNKLALLQTLKNKFNVLLLSNTNNIHHTFINTSLMPNIQGGALLEDYFHRAYYSHRMLKRKPEAEIYQQVLDENNFLPQETLFLDDNVGNVEGARAVDIGSVLVDTPDFILEYFK